MAETPLRRKATLETFTIVWQAPPGFVAPYIQANAMLVDGPTLFTLMTGVEPREDALKMGQEVEMVVDRLREDEEGNTVVAWKFRPVK